MAGDIEVFARSQTDRLPLSARDARLPGRFNELYHQLLVQGLQEFPPIEGYETMHVMLLERAVYFFCRQKADEAEPMQSFDVKRYKHSFTSFIKTCEGLLKEARSISAEVAFKHNFIRQVVEVLDRTVADPEVKKLVARELQKIAV